MGDLPITPPNASTSIVERTIDSTAENSPVMDINVDIEHMPVVNDPRAWSPTRKVVPRYLVLKQTIKSNVHSECRLDYCFRCLNDCGPCL